MTPERWEQITEIYTAAVELGESERRAFIEKACGDDHSLRREVESLLEADRRAGNFIAQNALNDSPSLLTIKDFPSLSGRTLGHYEVLSRIGSGGMGEVYLARDKRLNRLVALKALSISFSGNPKYLQRFQTEAKAAATLNHPNIAVVYSVEEIDGHPFFTMEYVEGKTLDKVIPEGGFEIGEFLELFTALADALAHAHEKGVIHRDIKPGNIMITPAGTPKILDFGLAQIDRSKFALEASTLDLTDPGQILGTPAYMSPEQAEGKPVDHCSDIFSFGVVMYEALTGERPFKGDSYAEIASALLTKEPPPVTDLKPDTPFLLARLVTRCLKKERRRRFQSMSEVRVFLEEIKAAVEAGISMDSSSAPPISIKKRSARGWIFIPLLLFILLTAAVAIYYLKGAATEPPISFENVTLRKLSQTSDVVYAHITPDGKSVAFNTIDEDGKRSLWIRRVDDKNALQLLAPQPVFFWGGLTISSDGSQIYYVTAERDAPHGTLYRISSLGGAPRKLVDTVNDVGSLSPDGQRILYVRYGEKMQLLSADAADGSDERVILSADRPIIYRDPQFSADGEKIFVIKFELNRGEEYWSLIEIPAAGGEEKIIIPAQKPKISEIAVLKDGSGLLANIVDAISNLPQIFHVSTADGRLMRVTNDLNSYFGISVSDDGSTIVSAQRQFAKDVWLYSEDQSEPMRLTKESNVYSSAVFTPDGRIVYDAVDYNRPHIWIMNSDGSRPQQLTPNDSFDFEPRVTSDGRFIVFISERTGERKIWRMNLDGTNPQNLTPVSGRAFTPVLTADGKTVLFTWNKDDERVMGRVSIEGGEIIEQEKFSLNFTSYSPDGRHIAYVVYDEKTQKSKTCVREVEAAGPKICFDIAPVEFMVWAHDGQGLLFRDIRTDAEWVSAVRYQPISGGEPKTFLSVKPDSVFHVSQSYDGRKTAVVRGKLLTDAIMLTKIEQKK